MANKTFHRARLTNLSQGQAVDGCKQLEKQQDLLLGDPGHCLEYAGSALSARLMRAMKARL